MPLGEHRPCITENAPNAVVAQFRVRIGCKISEEKSLALADPLPKLLRFDFAALEITRFHDGLSLQTGSAVRKS